MKKHFVYFNDVRRSPLHGKYFRRFVRGCAVSLLVHKEKKTIKIPIPKKRNQSTSWSLRWQLFTSNRLDISKRAALGWKGERKPKIGWNAQQRRQNKKKKNNHRNELCVCKGAFFFLLLEERGRITLERYRVAAGICGQRQKKKR